MRQEKTLLLEDIKSQIENSSNFVVFNYSGIGVNTTVDFRATLAALGGTVEVVPKRLFVKAASDAGIALDRDALPGHLAVAFAGEDGVEVTKAIFKLRKDTRAVEVLVGCFENELLDANRVEKLSKLPSRDVMRSQFLGLLEAPMAQNLAVMQSLLCSVLYCLENKAEQDGGQS